jgi:hypothetical protein
MGDLKYTDDERLLSLFDNTLSGVFVLGRVGVREPG